jgi:glycolate oxidase FAD binding subunit
MTVVADSVEAICDAVRAGPRVLPVAGATKPALSSSAAPDVVAVDVSGLAGIVDYDPRELTVTALAGTAVADLQAALAEHGQHLPFDPPLAEAGATLGGVVAAGTTGPGGFAHGGIRDFVLGVQLVEGGGRLVGGGGRVVKNAAGFDLPKLMVGSLGRLGILTRLTFKVFPVPRSTTTVVLDAGDLAAALAAVAALGRSPLAILALDVEPPGRVHVRLDGPPATRVARVEAVTGLVAEGALQGAEEHAHWRGARELRWVAAGASVVRVALAPRTAAALVPRLEAAGAVVRLSLGANLAWVAWPADASRAALHDALCDAGARGVALTGPPGDRLVLGPPSGGAFGERLREALDPQGRFPED